MFFLKSTTTRKTLPEEHWREIEKRFEKISKGKNGSGKIYSWAETILSKTKE